MPDIGHILAITIIYAIRETLNKISTVEIYMVLYDICIVICIKNFNTFQCWLHATVIPISVIKQSLRKPSQPVIAISG